MYRTARTTPLSRIDLLREAERLGVARAARNFCVSRQTVYRWRRRPAELEDRSSRPQRSPRRTAPEVEAALLGLRLETRWGPDRLGPYLGLSRRTAYRILRRHDHHRLRRLFPVERRTYGTFAVSEPGYIAVDIKHLGRLDRGGGRRGPQHSKAGSPLVGWRYLHVAIDLASRLVYAELRPGLTANDCAAFLSHAVAFFNRRGIQVRRVLSDNGSGYRGPWFALRCRLLGIRHTRTQPRHPWTNGRAERFIGTIQQECLYARQLTSEAERETAIAEWLAFYNAARPHTSLGGLSPSAWLRARTVTHVPEAHT
jgi:transposase InsO family protein